MVYRYSGRGLEIKAEEILRQWNPDCLTKVARIDIETFDEQHVKADINWFRLSNDGNRLGLDMLRRSSSQGLERGWHVRANHRRP